MLNNGTQETSLEIKQNDRFFSRLLSKESSSSIGAPSFRVYYGGENVNVPFTWESKPGTPKHHTLHDHDHGTILPPLTPPPSYYSTKMPIKKKGKSNFFLNLLPKLIPKKPRLSSSSSSSSSRSSSSSESSWKSKPTWSSSMTLEKSRSSTVRSILYDHQGMDDDDEEFRSMSPTSTLCFGLKMPR